MAGTGPGLPGNEASSRLDLTRARGALSVLVALGGRNAGRRDGTRGATRKPLSGATRVPRDPGTLVSWRHGKSQESAKFSGTELTPGRTRSKVRGLPRWRDVVFCCGGAGFLRTQQRVKSQCIFCTKPPSRDGPFLGCVPHGLVMVCSVAGWLVFPGSLCGGSGCGSFNGEFDPGSGRTLAACLTHASRAERPLRGYSSGERVSNT